MQSFASPLPTTPTPIPHPTKITHYIKRAQLSLIPTPFLPKNP